EGVRIGQRAMFGPVFNVVAALHKMEASSRPDVGSDKDPSFAVEVKSPGIATAFCKQFELFRCRMIAPDSLPQKFDASDVARGSAALHAVKPTVRPPVQTVGYGVCIFKAETGKAHFGITVRHVIFVVV